MPRSLNSFDGGAVDHVPDEDSLAAGAWVFGGGIQPRRPSVVHPHRSVTDGPDPETKAVVGGPAVLEVADREEALGWAARTADGCRCPQQVREITDDPES